MYQVTQSLIEPELSIKIQPDEDAFEFNQFASKGVSVDDLTRGIQKISFGYFGNEAVDFEFGPSSSSSPWSPFSLFILFMNGDIYSVCPFVPAAFRAESQRLESLLISSHLGSEAHLWLKALQRSRVYSDLNSSYFKSAEIEKVIVPPRMSHMTPRAIGPIIFSPSPEDTGDDAVDLIFLDCKLDCFGISYASGKVDFFVSYDRIGPSWVGMSHNPKYSVGLFETIDLKIPSIDNVPLIPYRLFAHKIKPHVLYLYGPRIYEIEANWIHELWKNIQSNTEIKEPSASSCRLLAAYPENLTSVDMRLDSVLGNHIICLTDQGRLKILESKSRFTADESHNLQAPALLTESALKLNPFQNLLDKYSEFNAQVPKKTASSNDQDELVKIQCELRKCYLAHLTSVQNDLQSRLDLHKNEIDYQKSSIEKLQLKLTNLQECRMRNSNRIKAIQKWLQESQLKFQELHAQYEKYHRCNLSNEELNLLKQVQSTRDTLEGLSARHAMVHFIAHNS